MPAGNAQGNAATRTGNLGDHFSKGNQRNPPDIEMGQQDFDEEETVHRRPARKVPLTLPSLPRPPGLPSRKEKIVGLKDAGTLNNSWKAKRREFLQTTRDRNNSTDTVIAKTKFETIEAKEKVAREKQLKNPLWILFLSNLAAVKVMFLYLVTPETIMTCGLTAGMIVYWFNYGQEREEMSLRWSGNSMDFVVLAFAVTSPIATAIGMAFTRRENALVMVAEMRSYAHHLYLAHCLWDWASDHNGGRKECTSFDFLEHCDAVMAQLVGIGDELSRFLTLPTTSRSRNRMTRHGRREAARTIDVAYRLLESMVTQRITRLSVYGERLKALGLSTSEISRIRQYERWLQNCIERLRMYKMYRTPQALRSFARIFTFLLPPFYAPKFAQVALDLNSLGIGLGFGIITAIGLTALFESLQVLEDPFVGYLALDGIDVREEFEVLLWSSLVKTRKTIFPDAHSYPTGRRAALVPTDGTVTDTVTGTVGDGRSIPRKPSTILISARPGVLSSACSQRSGAGRQQSVAGKSIESIDPGNGNSVPVSEPPQLVRTASELSFLTVQSQYDREREVEEAAEFGYPILEEPESEEFLRQTNFQQDGQFVHHRHKRTKSAASTSNLLGLVFRNNASQGPSSRPIASMH